MNLTILGAGAWGTALAVSAATRHSTRLWARDDAQAAAMVASRTNSVYLPDVALPAALQIDADFDAAFEHARGGLLIIATPMSALEEMLRRIAAASRAGGSNADASTSPGVLWLCKGFEQRSGLLGHELARAIETPMGASLRVGVLSGPSFAIEVARAQPTALVAASDDAALCAEAIEALHSDSLRVYTSDDPIGVEVGGAVKNVLAIATGIADGMQLGLNARAALITRGLAEMTRLGTALGARAETFMGLSGLGDLVLTATGDLSRNRTVGRRLAEGLPLPRILLELGHVAEGVGTAPMVLQRARALQVDMPITQAVVAVLDGSTTPARALEALMGREAKPEA
jgi:glycerol-3-phosphate dehydrogenase (NAD(P)+)